MAIEVEKLGQLDNDPGVSRPTVIRQDRKYLVDHGIRYHEVGAHCLYIQTEVPTTPDHTAEPFDALRGKVGGAEAKIEGPRHR